MRILNASIADNWGVILAVSPIAIAIIWLIIASRRVEKKEEKDIYERWEKEELEGDELLFDEYTGKKYTIEEARRGITVSEEDLNRVKSEEEILEYYEDGLPKEEELAKNELRKAGIKVGHFNYKPEEILLDSKAISTAADWRYDDVFQLAPAAHLCFLTLDFYNQRVSTRNILLIAETKEFLGHYLMFYVSDATKWLIKKTEQNVITTESNFIIDVIKPVNDSQKMVDFLMNLNPSDRITIETCENYLFVFTNEATTRRELSVILDIYSRLMQSKYVRLKETRDEL